MPRAKDDTSVAANEPQTETGFAALEAKVEEVQVEAAIEAELTQMDDAMLRPARSFQGGGPAAAPSRYVALRAPFPGGSSALLAPAQQVAQAMGDCLQASLRLNAETIASFASVRTPQDLLAAQAGYGRGVMELYLRNLTTLGRALTGVRL